MGKKKKRQERAQSPGQPRKGTSSLPPRMELSATSEALADAARVVSSSPPGPLPPSVPAEAVATATIERSPEKILAAPVTVASPAPAAIIPAPVVVIAASAPSAVAAAPAAAIAPSAPTALAPPSEPVAAAESGVRPKFRDEHRSSERISLEVELHLASDSHFFSGLSGDISEGGVFISTYRRLAVGSLVELEFSLPGSQRPVRARGVVRWHRAPSPQFPPGVGVAFEDLGDDDRAAIHAFCSVRPPLYYDDVG
jgi:uncharacterized protein (TIGR02266 family)